MPANPGEASIRRRADYVCAMISPPLAPDRQCPICGKPVLEQFRPFCSRRCGDVDLNRWMSGVYAIPVRETDDDPDRPPVQDRDAE
jgi:endogenous inhibitor of DNA gyrase (YacG/DUF329 family)